MCTAVKLLFLYKLIYCISDRCLCLGNFISQYGKIRPNSCNLLCPICHWNSNCLFELFLRLSKPKMWWITGVQGSKEKGIWVDRWDLSGERLGCGGLWSQAFSLPCPHFPHQVADQLFLGFVPTKAKLVSCWQSRACSSQRSAASKSI